MWFEILTLSQQFIISGCIGYAIFHYVRCKYLVGYYIIESDELIEQLLQEPMVDKSLDQLREVVTDQHRERLAALVAGGILVGKLYH